MAFRVPNVSDLKVFRSRNDATPPRTGTGTAEQCDDRPLRRGPELDAGHLFPLDRSGDLSFERGQVPALEDMRLGIGDHELRESGGDEGIVGRHRNVLHDLRLVDVEDGDLSERRQLEEQEATAAADGGLRALPRKLANDLGSLERSGADGERSRVGILRRRSRLGDRRFLGGGCDRLLRDHLLRHRFFRSDDLGGGRLRVGRHDRDLERVEDFLSRRIRYRQDHVRGLVGEVGRDLPGEGSRRRRLHPLGPRIEPNIDAPLLRLHLDRIGQGAAATRLRRRPAGHEEIVDSRLFHHGVDVEAADEDLVVRVGQEHDRAQLRIEQDPAIGREVALEPESLQGDLVRDHRQGTRIAGDVNRQVAEVGLVRLAAAQVVEKSRGHVPVAVDGGDGPAAVTVPSCSAADRLDLVVEDAAGGVEVAPVRAGADVAHGGVLVILLGRVADENDAGESRGGGGGPPGAEDGPVGGDADVVREPAAAEAAALAVLDLQLFECLEVEVRRAAAVEAVAPGNQERPLRCGAEIDAAYPFDFQRCGDLALEGG